MQKIAVVSPTPLFPQDGGNRARVLALVRALRGLGHDVHFLYLDIGDAEASDGPAMEAEMGPGRLHWLRGRRPEDCDFLPRTWRRVAARLRLPAAHQYGLDGWFDPAFTAALEAIDRVERFDAVMVEYVFMSKAFDAFSPRAARLLDTHDAFGDRWRELKRAGIYPHWYSTGLRDEVRGFNRADVVIAIQEAEAKRFETRLGPRGAPVRTVSHFLEGVGEGGAVAYRPAAAFLASKMLINRIALDWFIAEVMPRVLAEEPGFRLTLAGTICSVAPDGPAIEKLGFVDHPRDLFARAPIAINPVRNGTGINIKLLDALGAGAPVVSTATGARGLAARDMDAITVVADDDPGGFAEGVLALARNSALWTARHAAALATAERWNARQVEALASALAAASERARSRGAAAA